MIRTIGAGLSEKGYNDGKGASLFASTPPLEALRMLVSEAATIDHGQEKVRKVIMINDVARAFFEAKATRLVCVELPEEALVGSETNEEWVAMLEKSLYGTRDAALNFQREVKKTLEAIGFRVGRYNASTYYHPKKQLRMMVHGDDFVTVGKVEEVQWLRQKLEERFELKTTVVGKEEEPEGRILNRIVRCTEKGWEYEADQRHAEFLIKALNLQEANPLSTPQEEEKPWKQTEEAQKLDSEKATEYRSLGARANYLASDRLDIQFSVKEICRNMSEPTVGDRRKLKRLTRYLIGRPRLVSEYEFQMRSGNIEGYSDSNWAGCRKTAKSTSGGIMMIGNHVIKTWSSTQKSITLSSAEAELVAAVKMSTELIGATQMAEDWGIHLHGRVHVDSSAAIAIAERKGNGKLRHVRVGNLWIQEKVEKEELQIQKVAGEWNPADALTKGLSQEKMARFLRITSQKFEDGRAERSLKLKE